MNNQLSCSSTLILPSCENHVMDYCARACVHFGRGRQRSSFVDVLAVKSPNEGRRCFVSFVLVRVNSLTATPKPDLGMFWLCPILPRPVSLINDAL